LRFDSYPEQAFFPKDAGASGASPLEKIETLLNSKPA
jgi:hypothetical protein